LTRFSCHLSLGRNRGLAEIRIYILQGNISVFSIHNGMKLGLKIGVMRTSHHGEQRSYLALRFQFVYNPPKSIDAILQYREGMQLSPEHSDASSSGENNR